MRPVVVAQEQSQVRRPVSAIRDYNQRHRPWRTYSLARYLRASNLTIVCKRSAGRDMATPSPLFLLRAVVLRFRGKLDGRNLDKKESREGTPVIARRRSRTSSRDWPKTSLKRRPTLHEPRVS